MGLTKSNILLQYSINSVNIVGLCICIYALIVELHKDADPEYRAFCDFNENFSCSKALMSKWGRGFGLIGLLFGDEHAFNIRNPIMGIAFYILMVILTVFSSVISAKAMLWMAVISNIGSIYLAYIMYFYIKSICVVCCSLYVINFVLLILTYRRLTVIKQLARKKRD